MSSQISYYNRFASEYRQGILQCPEPHYWTTDYAEKGRVYNEIYSRVNEQMALIQKYFSGELPVLDIGCGFGRQAFKLAKEGYDVTGIDTSEMFIQTAKELFEQHQLKGEFFNGTVADLGTNTRFHQILLLDVLEHIMPVDRRDFISNISDLMFSKGVVIVSLPFVKKRPSSQLNNAIRRRLTGMFSFFRNREEHPFVIPQKKDMDRLFLKKFDLLEHKSSGETEYYVFRKR